MSEAPGPAGAASGEAEPAAASEAEPAAAAPAAATRLPVKLTILLFLIAALSVLGLWRYATQPGEFAAVAPNAPKFLGAIWFTSLIAGGLGATRLLTMHRWGLYLLAFWWLTAMVVDVTIGATQHAMLMTGLFGLALIWTLPLRGALK